VSPSESLAVDPSPSLARVLRFVRLLTQLGHLGALP
jgi:hypothetical protein